MTAAPHGLIPHPGTDNDADRDVGLQRNAAPCSSALGQRRAVPRAAVIPLSWGGDVRGRCLLRASTCGPSSMSVPPPGEVRLSAFNALHS
jgi:hypothetical protein